MHQALAAIALILTGAFVGPATSASEDLCSETRLDAPGGSMEHVGVVDQGKIGACYAFLAAQMVDAYRFSHGVNDASVRTSALEAMLAAGVELGAGDFAQGMNRTRNTCSVIRFLARSGICDQRVFEDGLDRELRLKSADGAKHTQDALKELELLFTLPDGDRADSDRLRQRAETIACELQNHGVPGLRLQIQELERILQADNPLKRMHLALASRCALPGGRIPVPGNPACQTKPVLGSPQKTRESIQRLLTGRPADGGPVQPVGVNLCSNFLREGHAAAEVNQKQPDQCRNHALMVIGQRKRSGKCELLVRNSWGTSCSYYSPDWDCESGRGNIWVDADVLARNVSVIYPMGGP